MPAAGDTSLLYTIAQIYLGLGYAVIPVHDNKVAAVEWKPYQRRRPTQSELQCWFAQENYAGAAIVTGAISGLVVLDFDDPALFRRFQAQYPDLVETRTIQTRRGCHLYFHLPPHLRLPSRKVPGVDLLSDGRYAVAPPSVIAGHVYKVTTGGQPKTLSQYDTTRIQAFLDALVVDHAGEPQSETCTDWMQRSPKASLAPSSQPVTPSDLVGLYRYLAPKAGRNEALFKVSLRARDAGWSHSQTQALLAGIHVQQQPDGTHQPETYNQRCREARRTIQSAFSRPPRRTEQTEPAQLPNTVREALFKRRQTYAVRVIEGLRLKGIQPGQTFTTNQALELLKGLVGRDSIYGALNAVTPAGEPLFVRPNPSPRPSTPAYAATPQNKQSTTKCFVVNGTKSGKTKTHRPARVFIMPGNLELAARLGVKPSRISDPILEDDLQSARMTRQAAHREFIRRCPGQYPARWLAGRLGISVITERRYNRDIPIQVVPMYTVTPIFWSNLGQIPPDMDIPGLFLQDEKGKRCPARQPIARRLLSQGKHLSLVRRVPNYYFYGERPPVTPGLRLEHPVNDSRRFVIEQPVRCDFTPANQHPPEQTRSVHSYPEVDIIPPQSRAPTKPTVKPRFSRRKYKKPLEDTRRESLALRIYTLVGTLSPDNCLSRANARRLTDQYDPSLIERALHRLEVDRKIVRPAGFLLTYLRSETNARQQREWR